MHFSIPQLISRKIWVREKSWNFHTVLNLWKCFSSWLFTIYFLGYQMAFDTSKSQLTKNNFAIGYTTGDFTLHTNVNDGQVSILRKNGFTEFFYIFLFYFFFLMKLFFRYLEDLCTKRSTLNWRLPSTLDGQLLKMKPLLELALNMLLIRMLGSVLK